MRNQGDFADTTRAFVCIEHLQQYGFAFRRLRVNDFSALKAHLNIVDQCSLMRKRFGG